MKFNLYYNDFNKNIELDISKKIGEIQTSLLNYCSLIIYNIENIEIYIDENIYILGDEELDFNNILENFLKLINKNENSITKFVIYDRKRDINGNVIKENNIIDKYNKWSQENYSENYINDYNILYNSNINTHIIQFPLSSILQNIFRVNNQNINQNNIIDEIKNDFINKENNDSLEEKEYNIINNENIDINSIFDELNKENNNLRNTNNILEEVNQDNKEVNQDNKEESPDIINKIKEDYINYNNIFFEINNEENNEQNNEQNNEEKINEQNNEEKINEQNNRENNNNYNRIDTNYLNTTSDSMYEIDNIIGIIDNYMRHSQNDIQQSFLNIIENNLTTNLNNIINDDYSNMPDLISMYNIIDYNNDFNYIYNDVKIVLNDEQFENLEKVKYEDINEINECLICIENFEENNEITKIKCNHIFHKECIKKWLCNESNKCPICRIEIDKGYPKST